RTRIGIPFCRSHLAADNTLQVRTDAVTLDNRMAGLAGAGKYGSTAAHGGVWVLPALEGLGLDAGQNGQTAYLDRTPVPLILCVADEYQESVVRERDELAIPPNEDIAYPLSNRDRLSVLHNVSVEAYAVQSS